MISLCNKYPIMFNISIIILSREMNVEFSTQNGVNELYSFVYSYNNLYSSVQAFY